MFSPLCFLITTPTQSAILLKVLS